METAVTLTIAEAAAILEPPVDLAPVIKALGWKPAGWKRTGKPGRPAPVYDSARLMRLHAALVPFAELTSNRQRSARIGSC